MPIADNNAFYMRHMLRGASPIDADADNKSEEDEEYSFTAR